MSKEIDFKKIMRRAPRVRLGDLIEQTAERNTENKFGVDDACGMTITKEIIPTKANLTNTDLSKFLIVYPQEFVYNPRTHGKKIGLGFNTGETPLIISWNNAAFKVKDSTRLLPNYLYLIFTREEWDREACYRSWGSSTEVFSWEELCLMTIPLPSIEVQHEIVAAYEGLKKIAEENEAMLPSLQSACHAYIVDCKEKYPEVELGDYIEQTDERNINYGLPVESVRGISNLKEIIPTKADMTSVGLNPYKVVKPKEFCFVTVTSRNSGKISLTMNNGAEPYIFSSSYVTFKSKDEKILVPDFLYILFNRSEFDRYSRFNSWGSARETFDWSEMERVKIPLPPIEVQEAIVSIYKCAEEAKRIARDARQLMKDICPALIQRAANSN